MTDEVDKQQELDQLFLDAAISNQLTHSCVEQPDEDEDGNRYCLDCGALIPPERIKANPYAVRDVSCQSRKEP